MSLSQAGNALNAGAPYAVNWRGLAGDQKNGPSGQAVSSLNAAARRQQMSSDFGNDSAQVTLSDEARALSAFNGSGLANATSGATSATGSGAQSSAAAGAASDGSAATGVTSASGSPDFAQEASYLGGITDASLVAMGVITPDQQAGTQITFDSLSYNVSSSASAGITQQGGQATATYGAQQQAEFVGQGQITTSDGRTFDFEVEVDLDQSQQMDASGAAGAGASQDNSDTAALAADAAPPQLPPTQGNSSSSAASPSSASADAIDWDAILSQSKSLFALLESLGTTDQAAQANGATNGVASTASNAATGAAGTTQGASGGGTSGDAQNPANSDTQAALSP